MPCLLASTGYDQLRCWPYRIKVSTEKTFNLLYHSEVYGIRKYLKISQAVLVVVHGTRMSLALDMRVPCTTTSTAGNLAHRSLLAVCRWKLHLKQQLVDLKLAPSNLFSPTYSANFLFILAIPWVRCIISWKISALVPALCNLARDHLVFSSVDDFFGVMHSSWTGDAHISIEWITM